MNRKMVDNMNVIIANEYKNILNSLDIEVIKNMEGEFTADEIIATFTNFFFNKMILDITALKDNKNLSNYQKLSMSIDMNKVIFYLDNNSKNDQKYISQLISLGIYNFASDKDSLMYLYNNPNLYKDVAHLHNINYSQIENNINNNQTSTERTSFILGIKNVTANAGATTLTYLLKKEMSKIKYTIALEINKNDFGYFNEKDMYSVSDANLGTAINKFSNANIILIDLNHNSGNICDDIIYLMEPSIIKLNKMMASNKDILNKLFNKKVILNKIFLSEEELKEFEMESGITILFNMSNINDRIDNSEIIQDLIDKLNI